MADATSRTNLSYSQKPPESGSPATPTIKLLAAVFLGAALLALSGLTLMGTVVSLAIAAPLLVLFSPVLVPAGAAVLLAFAGFLLSGILGASALTALVWTYNYLAGKHPPGSEQLDSARVALAKKAREVKERAKDHVNHALNHGPDSNAGAGA